MENRLRDFHSGSKKLAHMDAGQFIEYRLVLNNQFAIDARFSIRDNNLVDTGW